MKNLSTYVVAFALPCLALQGAEIPFYYDYGYPPPADYEGLDLGKLIVGAEWLYMKPAVDENYFAEKTVFTPGSCGSISRIAPDLNWDSGFRVHAGYALPFDQWTIDIAYTYFWTDASRSSHFTTDAPTTMGGIVPTLFNDVLSFSDGNYNTTGNWKWQYNQLDIDFSRISYLNRSVSLNPRAGFRFIWSQQHLNSFFGFDPTAGSNALSVRTANKNELDGFGIKFGLDTTWDIGFCGLSLYGNFDYSVLYGCSRLRQDLYLTEVIPAVASPFTQSLAFKSNPKTLKQMATLDFGLQWIKDFNCYESFLIVKAGWEYIFFSGFNMLIARDAQDFTLEDFSTGARAMPVSHTLRGDMGLYGLILGADFYF